MAQLTIARLVDHPGVLDTVAGWIDTEWGQFSGRTLLETRERFAQEQTGGALPTSRIALEGARPIGVATLRERDSVDWDAGATPWICNVFVGDEGRGKGVAGTLCRALEAIALELGYPHVYLATVMSAGSLYHRLGYEQYRRYDALGYPMYLMRRRSAA
ncbi:MAG: GNAT family N-acetyltransferase [Steroidobacteraceae bacterium]